MDASYQLLFSLYIPLQKFRGHPPRMGARIIDIAGECDAEANRRARPGASPAPTMTRLGRPIRIMVGVPLAGTLARDCIPHVIRQQSLKAHPPGAINRAPT